jgi:peptidoglycan/xylan/chitin deacetylase (PgdA/CDA1 family)
MNWRVWKQIENVLLNSGVKPLLAVVPDNRDRELEVDAPNDVFWNEVRSWQSRGWSIGLHGYQHRYVTNDPGIVGKNFYSEFAGLGREAQESKIRSALEIFRKEGIKASTWIAPAHSFDRTTLELLRESGLRTVSDGYFLAPGKDAFGTMWVPQQIWNFAARPFGVWTICLHHNNWTATDVSRLQANIEKYQDSIVDLESVLAAYGERRLNVFDFTYAKLLRWRIQAGKTARSWIRPTGPAFATVSKKQ